MCIPFSLLVYETVKRNAQGLQPNYGKWLVLFVVTFLFNGLTLMHSWIITLVDLCIKIGLFYLPEHMVLLCLLRTRSSRTASATCISKASSSHTAARPSIRSSMAATTPCTSCSNNSERKRGRSSKMR